MRRFGTKNLNEQAPTMRPAPDVSKPGELPSYSYDIPTDVDRLIKRLEDGKKELMKYRQLVQKLEKAPQTGAGKFLNSVGLPDFITPDFSGAAEEIDKKIKEIDGFILKLRGMTPQEAAKAIPSALKDLAIRKDVAAGLKDLK